MAVSFKAGGLENRLQAHEKSFDSLLKSIPAQYYISKELTEEEEKEQHSRYQHNKKRTAPKEDNKERLKKAKRAKLDPENIKSVTDLQSEKLAVISDDNPGRDNSGDNSDNENSSVAKNEDKAPVVGKLRTHNFEGLLAQVKNAAQAPALAPESITELRAKLEERLAKFRGHRNGAEASTVASKPTSRQTILETRLKRKKDKKAAQKLAKQKRAAGGAEGLIAREQAGSSSSKTEVSKSITKTGETSKKSSKEGAERHPTAGKAKDSEHEKREKNPIAGTEPGKNKGRVEGPSSKDGAKGGKPKARAGFEGKKNKKTPPKK